MNSELVSVPRAVYDAALYELIAAHRILQAVLAVTTTAQKAKLLKRVESLGVAGEGLVRHNERLLALNGLGVILAHVARAPAAAAEPSTESPRALYSRKRSESPRVASMRLHKAIAKGSLPTEAVIIYGPQGCGKTRYSAELLAYYGKSQIIDDWEPNQPTPDDAIILTHYAVKGAISYASAKAAILSGGPK